jgi:hypothetical protein
VRGGGAPCRLFVVCRMPQSSGMATTRGRAWPVLMACTGPTYICAHPQIERERERERETERERERERDLESLMTCTNPRLSRDRHEPNPRLSRALDCPRALDWVHACLVLYYNSVAVVTNRSHARVQRERHPRKVHTRVPVQCVNHLVVVKVFVCSPAGYIMCRWCN